jgi:rhodanese-related sulfurtransferase
VLIGWAQYTTCKMPVIWSGAELHAAATSLGRPSDGSLASSAEMPDDYTPQQVSDLLQRGEIQLIDVRQPHEHEAGRIAGDRLIELPQLSGAADTIARDRPVVFYCHSGGRSAMATQAFAQAGFDAHNLAGGIVAWEAAGLPLDPDGGYIAHP